MHLFCIVTLYSPNDSVFFLMRSVHILTRCPWHTHTVWSKYDFRWFKHKTTKQPKAIYAKKGIVIDSRSVRWWCSHTSQPYSCVRFFYCFNYILGHRHHQSSISITRQTADNSDGYSSTLNHMKPPCYIYTYIYIYQQQIFIIHAYLVMYQLMSRRFAAINIMQIYALVLPYCVFTIYLSIHTSIDINSIFIRTFNTQSHWCNTNTVYLWIHRIYTEF